MTDALLNGKIENLSKYTPEKAVDNLITNLWYVSTTVDHSLSIMKPGNVAVSDASVLANSPVTSGPFYAYREVLEVCATGGSHRKLIVRLTEAYPIPGRIWNCCYNTDTSKWSGWSSVGGSSY